MFYNKGGIDLGGSRITNDDDDDNFNLNVTSQSFENFASVANSVWEFWSHIYGKRQTSIQVVNSVSKK